MTKTGSDLTKLVASLYTKVKLPSCCILVYYIESVLSRYIDGNE